MRPPTASTFAEVGAAVGDRGLAIAPGFLSSSAVAALAEEARRRDAAGEFRAAGIGHGARRRERPDIRGDRILWLGENPPAAAEIPFWQALEALRLALNEALCLGLFAFEGHYALYPTGTFYRRHRDRFRDDDARVLSCVLYLNDKWTATDGGALRVHLDRGETLDVPPIGGTLVCFLADRFEHEVLPAMRERLAIAGWFQRRS